MPERQIVIPLYGHTTDEEIADIAEAIRRVGIDDLKLVVDGLEKELERPEYLY